MSDRVRFFGRVWLIAFFAAAIAVIWRYAGDLSAHLTTLQRTSGANLVTLLALQIAFWSILTLAWKLILRTLGAQDTPFAVCFWQQMLFMLGKYVPGKIWGMVARGSEMKRLGDGFLRVMTATSLEQMVSLHSGMLVAALILALLFPGVETGILAVIAVLTIPVAARFSALGLRMLGAIVRRLRNTGQLPAEVRIATGRYTVLVIAYASLWIISGLVFIGLYGIFVDRQLTKELTLALLLSNTAGIAAGFLAVFAPGGVGVREGVMVGLLLTYIPVEHAMLLAIVSRLWQVMSDMLGGALGLWLARHPRNSD